MLYNSKGKRVGYLCPAVFRANIKLTNGRIQTIMAVLWLVLCYKCVMAQVSTLVLVDAYADNSVELVTCETEPMLSVIFWQLLAIARTSRWYSSLLFQVLLQLITWYQRAEAKTGIYSSHNSVYYTRITSKSHAKVPFIQCFALSESATISQSGGALSCDLSWFHRWRLSFSCEQLSLQLFIRAVNSVHTNSFWKLQYQWGHLLIPY